MADIKIAPFEHTPIDDINKSYSQVHATFRTNKTKDVEWRLKQLRKLYWGLQDFTPRVQAALKSDLGKPPIDAIMSEVGMCTTDLMGAIANLKTWVKDDKNLDYPLAMTALKPRIKKEPIGTVLVIGPYNFPFLLCISPLIGAIAAGCTAILKPSESAPATAMVLQELIEKYLDPTAFRVVNGAIPETTALLDQKWDKIFYTGNPTVARIVYRKAAENLTPVVLELGGRNPAFVTKASDVALAARRLLWGKCVNAGQVCISHNYVQVQRELVPYFIECINKVTKDFFPQGPRNSPDYARIVNHRQFDRIKKMLDSTRGKIVMGGETDRDDLFIAPTAVLVESIDDPMMVDESFGPIWSILPFDNLDDAIKVANQVDPTPLSLMTFGSKEENEKILNSVTSGGASINDSFMHGSIPTLPFGGVGESGTGAYHGVASFDTFTHRRTVVETPGWMEGLLRARYVPYDLAAWKQYQWINKKTPNFDREGNQIKGLSYWTWMVFGLGGPSAKGALLRWILVLVSSYAAMTYGVQFKNRLLS